MDRPLQPSTDQRVGDLRVRLVVILGLSLAVACHADWPQFRGNPQLTGVTTANPPKTPRVLWTYEGGDAIESSAAIVGGVVYVGVGNGEVIALDLQTGKLKWKYKAGEGDRRILARRTQRNRLYWGSRWCRSTRSMRRTAKPRGRSRRVERSNRRRVIASGKVLIGSYDGSLYAIDAAKGQLAWQYKTKAQVHATPAVVGWLAFISGCDGILRAIRIADGQQAYRVEIGAYTGASPAIDGQFAYFGTYNNEVVGANLARRRIMWRYEHPQRKFPFYATAAVWKGKVFAGGRDKMLHALDTKTGKEAVDFHDEGSHRFVAQS